MRVLRTRLQEACQRLGIPSGDTVTGDTVAELSFLLALLALIHGQDT